MMGCVVGELGKGVSDSSKSWKLRGLREVVDTEQKAPNIYESYESTHLATPETIGAKGSELRGLQCSQEENAECGDH